MRALVTSHAAAALLFLDSQGDKATLSMGYPYPPGIIHIIWGWVIWVWVISGHGHG